MVLVAEESLDRAGNDRAWIVGGPLAGTFANFLTACIAGLLL